MLLEREIDIRDDNNNTALMYFCTNFPNLLNHSILTILI